MIYLPGVEPPSPTKPKRIKGKEELVWLKSLAYPELPETD
jgi:hypothetical protein